MRSSSEANISHSRGSADSFRRAPTGVSVSTDRCPDTDTPISCSGFPFTSTRLDPLTNRTLQDSELGLFVQDSFKATSRLTLDLGLRWDRFGSPRYEDGLMLNWDPGSGNVIIPAGKDSAVSPLYPANIAIVKGDVYMHPSNRNFVPRIGAAYRVTDRMVIRGGYGIFDETLGRYARVQGTGPFQISETYQNVITGGQPLLSFPNPFPASLEQRARAVAEHHWIPAGRAQRQDSPVQPDDGAAV